MKDRDYANNIMEIELKIRGCKRCILSETRNRTVPGEGKNEPKIMLIGEAPGHDEDQSGRPFVGRAGRILDQALEEAGLERKELFITSVIKCRPQQNRKPKREEIDKCYPFLAAQIKSLHPKAICLMGNTALKAVLNKEGVTKYRGKVMEQRFITTYHPAAVLRNRNLREDFVKDLIKAKDLAETQEDSRKELIHA